MIFAALLLAAASFDCAKAATDVEKLICLRPRLSELDSELAATWRAARKLNASLDAQKAWLAKRDQYCGADEPCLEAEYLARIAELRAAHPSLFAAEKPPAHIFGRYANELSSLVIKRGKGNRVSVFVQIATADAYACEIQSDDAEWSRGELRVVAEGCVLVIVFTKRSAFIHDHSTRCKDQYCGARASFDEEILEKKR